MSVEEKKNIYIMNKITKIESMYFILFFIFLYTSCNLFRGFKNFHRLFILGYFWSLLLSIKQASVVIEKIILFLGKFTEMRRFEVYLLLYMMWPCVLHIFIL